MTRFLTSTIALFTAAACTGGERNQTGECPADEECSPLTPYGLHFTGVPMLGMSLVAAPKITAVGGTQTIDLWVEEQNGDTDPLNLEFAANTDNGDALQIASAGQNSVVLRGVANGDDYLRVTEADNDLLFDRFEMEARVLDRVELRPATQETYLPSAPLGFYAGPVTVGLALVSATGERLADDSLALTWPGPTPTAREWDTWSFGNLGAGTVAATLTAAGRQTTLDIPVVDAIDAVLPLDDSFPEVIRVGDQGSFCFRATSGSLASVIGLTWTFEATGPVTAVIGTQPNCFALQANAVGASTLTATALGRSTEVSFTIEAAAKPAGGAIAAPRGEALDAAVLGDVRGERARLATD